MAEHVDFLWRRAPTGADFLVGTATLGGPTQDQSVPGGPYPIKRTHARAVLEEMQSVGRTPVGEILEGLHSMGEPFTLEQSVEERETEAKHHEQPLLLIFLHCSDKKKKKDRSVENEAVRLRQGRRE